MEGRAKDAREWRREEREQNDRYRRSEARRKARDRELGHAEEMKKVVVTVARKKSWLDNLLKGD